MKTMANWKLLIIALAFTAPLPVIVSQGCGSDPYTVPELPVAPIYINNNDAFTYDQTVTLKLHAEDTDGVAAYFVSENSSTPSDVDPGWVSVTPVTTYDALVPFTLSAGLGNKTVYVWYKDSLNNISDAANDSILVQERICS